MEQAIKGFEDYVINDSGDNERSVWSTKTNQWLKPRPMPNEYIQICFSKDGKHYYRYLHNLLGEAFLERGENDTEIDHINGCRTDNRLCNIRWTDKKGNMGNPLTRAAISRYRTGRPLKEEARRKLFKKVYQYTLEGILVKVWDCVKDVESEGFCRHNVAACCRGVVKTHKGYRWSYEPL